MSGREGPAVSHVQLTRLFVADGAAVRATKRAGLKPALVAEQVGGAAQAVGYRAHDLEGEQGGALDQG